MVCWQATLDDMMTRDEVNEHLRTVLMPSMVTLQRDAMGAFSAMLDDPAAPSHKLQ